METSETSQSEAGSAWRNGLYFGGICALVYIASAFIQDVTGTSLALVTVGSAATPLSLLNQVALVVALVLFFLAGWRTGQADPKLSSAAGAGLIAGLIVSVVEIGTIVVNQAFLYRTTIATLEREKRLSNSGFHFIMFRESRLRRHVHPDYLRHSGSWPGICRRCYTGAAPAGSPLAMNEPGPYKDHGILKRTRGAFAGLQVKVANRWIGPLAD